MNARFSQIIAALLLVALASGCSTANKVKNIGKAPEMTPTEDPSQLLGPRPLAMPMPVQTVATPEANSLWLPGSRTFFKDQRARRTGDILTVVIDISDQAQLQNSTERTRANSEQAQLPAYLGLESQLSKILPDAVNPSSLVDLGSDSTVSGDGSINRRERVALTVAAVVTQVLPNGNLVIAGRQEVRVNFEVRELTVTGVVRPEDISNTNQIQHTEIAEARISYGGRGHITDVQQARYGQQLYDIIFPF